MIFVVKSKVKKGCVLGREESRGREVGVMLFNYGFRSQGWKRNFKIWASDRLLQNFFKKKKKEQTNQPPKTT